MITLLVNNLDWQRPRGDFWGEAGRSMEIRRHPLAGHWRRDTCNAAAQLLVGATA